MTLLTIVSIKTGPYKLIVLGDLVHNSPKTAHTMLNNLGARKNNELHT